MKTISRPQAEKSMRQQLLDLLDGKSDEVETPAGARITLRNGALAIEGTADAVAEAKRLAARLNRRLLEQSRELTEARRQGQAEGEARRKALFRHLRAGHVGDRVRH